jgi:arylsulfatase A-like enzyme
MFAWFSAFLIATFSSLALASAPNIVFFLIDDLGFADCGFNGGKEIRTPQIDKLASEGTILDAHYVQPVCSPTRAALMTGRYAIRTGVYTIVRPHAAWGLPLQERTLANALKEAGYATHVVGKWHLGEFEPAYQPLARGFDHHYGHYFGAIDYYTHLRDGDLDWYRDGVRLNEEGYSTHLLAKEACRIIDEKDKAKPLFLYVPFNGVHSPMQVPESYLEPYGQLQGSRRSLAGMLAAVDEAIGQIVAALEKNNLRQETLIVFSSDNGGPRPGDNTPWRNYKGTIYEGGVRAAAFANWPGHIPAGVRNREPMHIIDWYPTLIGQAGGNLQQKMPIDGKDVWPMLTAKAKSPHEAILYVQSPDRAGIRMGDWKLLINASESIADSQPDAIQPAQGKKGKAKGKAAKGKGKAEPMERVALYNLANDVGETTNLAGQEPARVATMKAKLDEWLRNAVTPGHLAP